MKKLSLVKILGIFSVFYSSSINFADLVSVKASYAVFSLKENIIQAGGDNFEQEMQDFEQEIQYMIDSLERKWIGNRSGIGKIQRRIDYLEKLIEIADTILAYRQNPQQQLWLKLEDIARTYGKNMHELIRFVISKAAQTQVQPAPPQLPQLPQPPQPPQTTE
jgi:hypothetical protein